MVGVERIPPTMRKLPGGETVTFTSSKVHASEHTSHQQAGTHTHTPGPANQICKSNYWAASKGDTSSRCSFSTITKHSHESNYSEQRSFPCSNNSQRICVREEGKNGGKRGQWPCTMDNEITFSPLDLVSSRQRRRGREEEDPGVCREGS